MSKKENSSRKKTPAKSDGRIMIEAVDLAKFYGPFIAIRNLNFSVKQGEVVAFLGPNGAGKSTTMKLLTGFLSPSEGHAKIGGFDVESQRLEAANLIGYLPENGPLYNEMTPEGILVYLGRARGLSSSLLKQRLEYVNDVCALHEVWRKSIDKLSRGFRQRVGMALALLHDPEVLILDEPTSGLDPNQLQESRELIRSLGKSKTIVLSTHILQEVDAVCNRVILINEGEVVFDGSVDEMAGEKSDLTVRFHELTEMSV